MSRLSPSAGPAVRAVPRIALRSAIVALVAAAALIAGCGGSDTDGVAYQIGEPVEDSTIAAYTSLEEFGDTLSVNQFQQVLNQRTRGQRVRLADSVKQQLQRSMVEQLVDITALLAAARERGLTVDSAEVEANLNQMAVQRVQQRLQQMRRQAGSDSLLRESLAENGLTLEQLAQRMSDDMRQEMMQGGARMQMRRQLTLTRIVDSLRQETAATVEAPSSEAVQERSTEQAREMGLQQIIFRVPPTASQAQRDSIEQQANAVLDSARSGADFTALADRYNQGTRPGGTMGYQTQRQMARPYARPGQRPSEVPLVEAAFALQDSGDVVTEPVRTRLGYHLLRKTGERAGQPDTVRARRELTMENEQEALEQAIEDLRRNVTLHTNPEYVTVDLTQPAEEAQSPAQDG